MDHFPPPSSVLLLSLLSGAVVASLYSQRYLQPFLLLSISSPISIPPRRSRTWGPNPAGMFGLGHSDATCWVAQGRGSQRPPLAPAELWWLWRDECCFNPVCSPEASNNSTLGMSRRSVDQSGRAFPRIPSGNNLDDVCFWKGAELLNGDVGLAGNERAAERGLEITRERRFSSECLIPHAATACHFKTSAPIIGSVVSTNPGRFSGLLLQTQAVCVTAFV